MVLDRVSRMVIDERPSAPPPPSGTSSSFGTTGSSRPGHRRGSQSPSLTPSHRTGSSSSSGQGFSSTFGANGQERSSGMDFASFVLDSTTTTATTSTATSPSSSLRKNGITTANGTCSLLELSASPTPTADATSPSSSAGSLDEMGILLPPDDEEEPNPASGMAAMRGSMMVHPLHRGLGVTAPPPSPPPRALTAPSVVDNVQRVVRQEQGQLLDQEQLPPQRPAPRRFRVLHHPTTATSVTATAATCTLTPTPSTTPMASHHRPGTGRNRRQKRQMLHDGNDDYGMGGPPHPLIADNSSGLGPQEMQTPIRCNRNLNVGGRSYAAESGVITTTTNNSTGLLPTLTPPLRVVAVSVAVPTPKTTAEHVTHTIRNDGTAVTVTDEYSGSSNINSNGNRQQGSRKRRMLKRHRRNNASIGGGAGSASGEAVSSGCIGDHCGLLPDLSDIFGTCNGGDDHVHDNSSTDLTDHHLPTLPDGVAGNTHSRTRNGMAGSTVAGLLPPLRPFPDPFGLVARKAAATKSPRPAGTAAGTGGASSSSSSSVRPPRPSAPAPLRMASLSPVPSPKIGTTGTNQQQQQHQSAASMFDQRLDRLAAGGSSTTAEVPIPSSLVPKFRSNPLPFSANIAPQPRRAPRYGKLLQRRGTAAGGGSAKSTGRSSGRRAPRGGLRMRRSDDTSARPTGTAAAAALSAPAFTPASGPIPPMQFAMYATADADADAAAPPQSDSEARAIGDSMSFEQQDDVVGGGGGSIVMPDLSAPEVMDAAVN